MDIQGKTFVIRPVSGTAEELDELLQVYQQCEDFLALGPVPQASLAMVLADLEISRGEGGVYYGIYDPINGQMLGVVDFVVAGFEGNPELAYLSLLMIAAPYRGQGLGADVVRAVEDTIRAGGRVRFIQAGVQVNNPGGIRFWQRMGYRIVSGAEAMSDGTVAYRLWKDL